jgi:DNA-binding MarR family transcriptional regulator
MPAKFTFVNPLMRTWLLIHQSHNLMNRSENAVFAKLGLTTRKHSVLLAIDNLPDPVTVTNVANWLDRNSNGVSMLVDRMVKDGLISRVRDMPDRRSVRLKITPRGEKLVEESRRLTWQLFQSLFFEIPEEELQKVGNLLEKVRGRAFDFLKVDQSTQRPQVIDEGMQNPPRISRMVTQEDLEAEVPDNDDDERAD